MDRKKLRSILYVLLPVIVVVLTALPECVQIRTFAEDGVEEILEYCSGFSAILVKNGILGPLVTGVLSCVIAVLSFACLKKESKRLCKVVACLSLSATLVSLIPMLVGTMTKIEWEIFAVLDAETVIACEMLLL